VASLVDELFHREGQLDPDLVGVNQAHAADLDWVRNKGESEREFLGRVTREAAAAGYRVVHILGALQVDDIVQLRRPMPPDIA
jgi:hypothetical protein